MKKQKSLKINYFYNTSYQILAIIAPLITTPYISRVLKADGVGIYNYVYSIANIFSLICALGTRAYAQREIACTQDNIEERSRLFYEVMIIKGITFVIVSVIYFFLTTLLKEYSVYLYSSFFIILSSVFDISWLFQGLEDFRTTVFRNFIIKLIGIILVFLFVKTQQDVIRYILIIGISMLLGQIYMWLYIPKIIKQKKLTELHPLQHLRPIIILFLPAMATYVYTSLDKVMLGSLATNAEVGYYSQAEKIVKLVMSVITSLGTVLIPRMARLIRSQEWNEVNKYFSKSVNFVFLLACPLIFGLIGTADEFIPLFLGEGYEKSILLLRLLTPLIAIIGLASVTGQAMLVSMGKQIYYTITVLCGAGVNFILNLILIPHIQSVGATIATLMAEIVVSTMQIYGIRKKIDLTCIVKNYKYFIGSGIMFGCIICMKLFGKGIMSSFVLLFCEVFVGFMVYSIFLLVTRDKFVFEIGGNIRKRMHS